MVGHTVKMSDWSTPQRGESPVDFQRNEPRSGWVEKPTELQSLYYLSKLKHEDNQFMFIVLLTKANI